MSQQTEDTLHDPQIAPYIDAESGEVTQVGPDGKRRPISELSGEQKSSQQSSEAADTKADTTGQTSDAGGSGTKPEQAPKAAADKGQAAAGR